MTGLNEQKIAFIICSNNDYYLQECFNYLSLLNVPENFSIDTFVIPDAVSMAAGYNEGMKASDAKYKIYMHQDVFIRHRDFLIDIIEIFASDPQIGLIGLVGAPTMSRSGVMWDLNRVGHFYRLENMKADGIYVGIDALDTKLAEVEAVDGLAMITQYDLPWREDIFTGWDFYDVSQCFEFRKANYRVVVPRQEKSWYIHDAGAPKIMDNYEFYRKELKRIYPEFFPYPKLFLFCYSDVIKSQHIPWGLLELGFEVLIDEGEVHIQKYDVQSKDDFAERLKEYRPDYVITFDLSPEIAEACHEVGVPYIAWSFDSPLKELNGWFALHPTTHAFCMDKKEIKRMQIEGKEHPHLNYMHLAANIKMMQGLKISGEDEKLYSHEIAMVASLYDTGQHESFIKHPDVTEQVKFMIEEYINMVVGDWHRDSTIYDKLPDDALETLIKIYGDVSSSFNMPNRRYYEALLGREITHRERVMVLRELAKEWDVHLHTSCKNKENIPEFVTAYGIADPTKVAPKIYRLSKINLNITLRSIETSTPLRIFDIMSAGGFIISNYQREMADLFVVDKEIVLFESMDELKEKVRYYLSHEKERQRIASAGYEKVKRCYSYPQVLKQMIEIVDRNIR